jgi:hypothetical protein
MKNKEVAQALKDILEDTPIQRAKVQSLLDRLNSVESLSSWYESIEADDNFEG